MRVEYQGQYGEGYFQTIKIDLSDLYWDTEIRGVNMFNINELEKFCSKIPEETREEFMNLIYSRILILKKDINPNIKSTELILRKFGTRVLIEGIGGSEEIKQEDLF